MKKIFAIVTLFLILCSSSVYAGGDKNRGSKGQGSTGTTGGGATTQTRGNQVSIISVTIKAGSEMALPFVFKIVHSGYDWSISPMNQKAWIVV